MNKLFKENILDVNIPVQGETDKYTVKISFGGVLDQLHKQLKTADELNLKIIIRALLSCFNDKDVRISCSCPDWYYRFSYVATLNNTNSGEPQTIPAPITNPNDDKGSGCKHTCLALSNTTWLIKLASTIYNYINYMKQYQQKLYADIIYPAIYDKEYEEPVQTDLFSSDELDDSSEVIDKSNEYAKNKGKFKQGNTQGVRFAADSSNKQFDYDSLIDNTQ